jgi:6,7-dimethyl-8-ribityllumazine synthase
MQGKIMQKAQKADFAPFDASDWQVGIVVAQFNQHITSKLEASAIQRAAAYNISTAAIDSIPVAGAIEIPLVLQKLAQTGKYTVLLAIGCVIKGDTPHFDYVCRFVSDGILRVQLDTGTPIGFGVLTCNDEAQAISRAELGAEHLDAVLQQARFLAEISPKE